MKLFYPDYYKEFQCLAGACPDSCCKEWEVDVDASAASFYRNLEGPLGERLRQVLNDTEDGTVMVIEEGRCPMWRPDGLCRIQAELGHDALCQTCREFPRLRHDYGDFQELGLELSCPEAARLILTKNVVTIEEELSGGEAAEYDVEAMEILLESRKQVLAFLETTSLPVNHALTVALLYGHEVQSWLDGGVPARLDASGAMELAHKYAAAGDWSLFTGFFLDLEILTVQWKKRLLAPAANGIWDRGYIPLMRYFISRYWLQAVSDYDLIGRIKLMIAACLLIYHLGGSFVETAQQFSKEIENDPDNLEAIFDGAYTSPALTDVHLLSLLLNS